MNDVMKYVLPLTQITLDQIPLVGGKNASLGEMVGSLADAGVRVPGGFALTVEAYCAHLAQHGIEDEVHARLDDLDVDG